MMRRVLVAAVLLLIASPSYAQVNLGTSASVTNPQRTGDATTGLFSPAVSTVAVSSGSTEKMRINATGVGIGTTSPSYPLDVLSTSGSLGRFSTTAAADAS